MFQIESGILEVDLDGIIIGLLISFCIFILVTLLFYKTIYKNKLPMTLNGPTTNDIQQEEGSQVQQPIPQPKQLQPHLINRSNRCHQWMPNNSPTKINSNYIPTPQHHRTLSAPISTTSSNSSYSSTNSSCLTTDCSKSFMYHQVVKETKIDSCYENGVDPNSEFSTKVNNNNSGEYQLDEDVEEDEDEEVLEKPLLVEISLQYNCRLKEMSIHMIQACDVPNRDEGQVPNSRVRLAILPMKKIKYKTKVRAGICPQFLESFTLKKIEPNEVHLLSLRLRLYRCERILGKERLLGQTVVPFSCLNLEIDNNLWLSLDMAVIKKLGKVGNYGACTGDVASLTRSNSTTSSTQSVILQQQTQFLRKQRGNVPEILLGLAFNGTTGFLTVEVIKGSCFRNSIAHTTPDSYVKLTLLNSIGHEMGCCKTACCKKQSNPLFKETFRFQVTLYQLADVTLMVAVYNRRGVTKKKEIIGWFSLGLNSSGPEQFAHWMDMKDAYHAQVCRWHVLILSPMVMGFGTML